MKKLLIIFSFLLLAFAVSGQAVIRSNPNARAQVSGTTYGPEKITNGALANATAWSVLTGWTVSGGVATYDDVTASARLRQADGDMVSGMEASTTYKLEFDITIASGNAYFRVSGYDSGGDIYIASTTYANGHHILYFTTDGDVGLGGITFWAYDTADSSFSVDNISLKEQL